MLGKTAGLGSSGRMIPLVLSVVSILMILTSYLSLLHHKSKVPDNCETPYMYESYATLNEFNSKYSRMGSKYSLKYYREGNGIDTNLVPEGVPVLFIPGNAGSYRQVRSLASYCSVKSKTKQQPSLDFFTADLNNDFTAFHGSTLLDQAEFLNDAIDYILGLYAADPKSKSPPPSSVIVIGHSMGGIVARTMLTLPNYVPDSINTILTLSTPHVMPPLSFERDLVMIYERVNQYWRESFAESNLLQSPLSNMALISITGGQSDNMVPSDLTDVSSLVHPDHGFTTFTYSIPGVWTGIDHLAIVWCVALRNIIGESLFSVIDDQSASKTKPLAERMAVLESKLLSPFDRSTLHHDGEQLLHNFKGVQSQTKKPITTQVYTGSTALTVSSDTLTSSRTKRITIPSLGDKHGALYSIPLDTPKDGANAHTIGIFTNATSLDSVKLLLCERTKVPKIRADISLVQGSSPVTYLNCYDAPKAVPAVLPASFRSSKLPSDNNGKNNLNKFYYFSYNSNDASKTFTDFIVYDQTQTKTGSFLEAETISMDYISVNDSTSSLFFSGNKVQLRPEIYSDVSLSVADSSLISYNIKLALDDKHCNFDDVNFFAPLIRQYLPQPLESRYHVNAADRSFTISTHGPQTPYMPFNVGSSGNNLHFQVFLPPVICKSKESKGSASLTISIDLWASLSNIVLRYRTLLATLPLCITLAIFSTQLASYNSCGIFPDFLESLYTSAFSHLTAWIAGSIALFIILGAEPARKVLRRFQLFNNGQQERALSSFDPSLRQNELFIGTSDLRFWFLGPLFLLTAIGLSAILYLLLCDVLLPIIVQPLKFLQSRRLYKPNGPNHSEKDKKAWAVRKMPSSKESIVKDYVYVVSSIVLVGLLVLVPYQIMFLALSCFQVLNTAGSSMVSRSNSNADKSACINVFNLKISLCLIFLWLSVINGPFLVVWIHSVSLKWSIAFSTWHNIVAILPILALIRHLKNSGEMIPQMVTSRQRLFNKLLLWYISLYALLFGVVGAYMMHHLISFVCLWLVIVFVRGTRVDRINGITLGRLPTSNAKGPTL